MYNTLYSSSIEHHYYHHNYTINYLCAWENYLLTRVGEILNDLDGTIPRLALKKVDSPSPMANRRTIHTCTYIYIHIVTPYSVCAGKFCSLSRFHSNYVTTWSRARSVMTSDTEQPGRGYEYAIRCKYHTYVLSKHLCSLTFGFRLSLQKSLLALFIQRAQWVEIICIHPDVGYI